MISFPTSTNRRQLVSHSTTMARSSLSIVLFAALVAAALATSVIKKGGVCTDQPNDCAEDLACDGKGSVKKCIEYKLPGMECRANEPFWICSPGLTCADEVCKIPQGVICTDHRDDCVEGTECDGRGDEKRCLVYKQAGMQCRIDEAFWICQEDLTCQDDTCKIPQGGECTNNRDDCVAGTTCGGEGATKRCIVVKEAGEQCTAGDASEVCASGLSCEDGSCQIPRNGVCTDNPDACVDGTDCDGRNAEKRCIVYKEPGMECRPNEPFWICRDGLTCEDRTCKISQGAECTDSRDDCVDGTTCGGEGATKRCIVIKEAGETCSANDDSEVCASGLSCEGGSCQIPRNGVCTNEPDACVDGTTCGGRGSEKRCIVIKKAGETCIANNAFDLCEDGLSCMSGSCRIPRNGVCTATPDACAEGTDCDGRGAEKRCIVYKQAGMECRPTEPFWICESGLSCENRRCKIPLGSSCASAPTQCADGATCAGSGRSRKCAPLPRELGEKCDGTLKCKRGFVCDGLCKLPKQADCLRHPTGCIAGTLCSGTRLKKLCSPVRSEGHRCSEVGFMPCGPGLSCVKNVCARGTVPSGARCQGAGEVCKAGLLCGGPPRNRICVKPMQKGQFCKGDPYWKCAQGLRCLDKYCVEY